MERRYLAGAMHFVVNAVISTIGSIVLSGILVFELISLLHHMDPAIAGNEASRLLTEVPLFPIQAVISLLLGFFVGRHVSPTTLRALLLIPLFLFIAAAVMSYREGFPFVQHFLGYGCGPQNRCFDQFVTTLPAITTLSYVFGASVNRRVRHSSRVLA